MNAAEQAVLEDRLDKLDRRIEVVTAELQMLKDLRRRRALEYVTRVASEELP